MTLVGQILSEALEFNRSEARQAAGERGLHPGVTLVLRCQRFLCLFASFESFARDPKIISGVSVRSVQSSVKAIFSL